MITRKTEIVLQCFAIVIIFKSGCCLAVEEPCWSWNTCSGWFAMKYQCYTKIQPIEIPVEYKWLVQTACPKLGVSNHTCCYKERLMELYKYDTLLRNKYYLALCPQCLYNIMNFLCDVVCGLDGEKYRSLTSSVWQSQREYYDLIIAWKYIKETFQSCKNIRLPHNNMLLTDYMCGQYNHYTCTPMRMFYNLPEWQNVTHIRGFYRYIFNITKEKLLTPYQKKTYACNAKFQPTKEMPVFGPCKCRDCSAACPKHRIVHLPESELEEFRLENPHYFQTLVISMFSLAIILFVTGFMSVYFCRGQDVTLVTYDKWEDGTARTFTPFENNPLVKELSNVDQFDDQFGVCLRPFLVRLGARIPNGIEIFFDWWGRLWGNHSGLAMFIGLALVVALSHGVSFLHISVDPEEYLVANSARSQLEKSFFEAHFDPFFRINTVIIHVKKIRYFEHHRPVVARDPRKTYFFGPAFNDSILLIVKNLTDMIKGLMPPGEKKVRFRDFCFDPYAESPFVGPKRKHYHDRCVVNSVWAWFQNNVTLFKEMRADKSYLDRIIRCTDFPDHVDCLPPFGRMVHPALVLGGFLTPQEKLTKKANYLRANTHVVQFVFDNNNDPIYQRNVYEWEKEFTAYMNEWVEHRQPAYLDVAFKAHSAQSQEAEDSPKKAHYIQDAYFITFLYLALCWSTFSKVSRLVVDTRFMVAAGAVGIIYSSVTAASGLIAYIDGMGTDITEKMLPVLMLALGANNLQLFSAVYWREMMKPDEPVHKHVGRVLGQIGGAMFLSSVLQGVVLYTNRQNGVPTLWWFAILSCSAVAINFLVVMTFGIGMYAFDRRRYLTHRFDILICITAKARQQSVGGDGIVFKFFKYGYTPFLMNAFTRCFVIVYFTAWFCSSLCVVPLLEVAPSNKADSLPKNTYLNKYFAFHDRYVHLGPEVYFVVTEGFDVSHPKLQEIVGMQRWNTNDSMVNLLYEAHLNPTATFIALPPISWFDDFMDWLKVEECCKVFPANGTFCPNDYKDDQGKTPCVPCNITHHLRRFGSHESRIFYRNRFRQYVSFFMKDHASPHCIKGGMAEHSRSVNMLRVKGLAVIKAFYFRTHFTSLHTYEDMKRAMLAVRTVATSITSMIHREIRKRPATGQSREGDPLIMYAISPFFSQFEQFNSIWSDLVHNTLWTLLFIFIVAFIVLGLDLYTALALSIYQMVCVINTMAFLFWNRYPVNAYTCIFLMMSQAMFISPGCYLCHAYSTSAGNSRVMRAAEAITEAGPTVLMGSLCMIPALFLFYTNFVVMYRKVGVEIYSYTIMVAMVHGLVFMPVLLSLIGSARNRRKVIYHLRRKCEQHECPSTEYDVVSKLYLEPFDGHKKSKPMQIVNPSLKSTFSAKSAK